ncbi:hypothetical protein D9M73_264700 [compost metagenome]
MQVPLGTGPAALGKIELALFDRQADTSAAVTPRPRVDHTTGSQHQADQIAQQPQQQDDRQNTRQGSPQPRLITEATIGNQYIAAVLGDRDAQCRSNHDRKHGQQVDTLHGLPPSASAGR